jgi:hypothetical protein
MCAHLFYENRRAGCPLTLALSPLTRGEGMFFRPVADLFLLYSAKPLAGTLFLLVANPRIPDYLADSGHL